MCSIRIISMSHLIPRNPQKSSISCGLSLPRFPSLSKELLRRSDFSFIGSGLGKTGKKSLAPRLKVGPGQNVNAADTLPFLRAVPAAKPIEKGGASEGTGIKRCCARQRHLVRVPLIGNTPCKAYTNSDAGKCL